jgi:pimeloyl-[acyl-carrier protein] methyl ester esterase
MIGSAMTPRSLAWLALQYGDTALVALIAIAVFALGLNAIKRRNRQLDRKTALFRNSKMFVRERISVEILGRGPDVIFIPGLSSSRATWQATAEQLKNRFRLHLVQVAGFAGEPTRGNASGEVVVPTAEAIAAYIVERRLAPATLIGHSLGGTMSLYLAETHPAEIARIMIVDAFPFLGTMYGGPDATRASVKAMIDSWRGGEKMWSREQNEQLLEEMVVSPTAAEVIKSWSRNSDPSVVMRALFEDMLLDLRPGLSGISSPVAVLFPDYVSPNVPTGLVEAARASAYEAVPRKEIAIIERSRHFIMWDQPGKFAAALDAFLAS